MNGVSEPIVLRPERDVEILKLTLKGLSDYKIAQKLHTSPSRISQRRKQIEKNYSQILEYVKSIKRTKYFSRLNIPRRVELTVSQGLQLAEQGYYVGAKPPIGYDKLSEKRGSVLTPNDQMGPLIAKIIEGYYIDGKPMWQLSRETGIQEGRIEAILHRNIRIYLGYVKFQDKWFRGQHQPLVRKELEPIIMKRLAAPKPLYNIQGRPPLGLISRFDRWEPDPKESLRIREIYELRLKGVGINEIGRKVGLPGSRIVCILQNPIFAGKIEVDGRLVDCGVSPIVSFQRWQAVQSIRDRRPLWLVSKEARKRRVTKLIDEIRIYIAQENPTTGQIIEKFGLSPSQTDHYLRSLRREGFIEKRSGKFGTWHIKK